MHYIFACLVLITLLDRNGWAGDGEPQVLPRPVECTLVTINNLDFTEHSGHRRRFTRWRITQIPSILVVDQSGGAQSVRPGVFDPTLHRPVDNTFFVFDYDRYESQPVLRAEVWRRYSGRPNGFLGEWRGLASGVTGAIDARQRILWSWTERDKPRLTVAVDAVCR